MTDQSTSPEKDVELDFRYALLTEPERQSALRLYPDYFEVMPPDLESQIFNEKVEVVERVRRELGQDFARFLKIKKPIKQKEFKSLCLEIVKANRPIHD